MAQSSDGHTYVAVVAKNKLFQFWDVIPHIDGIQDVQWYVSDRQIFETFPVAVSPSLIAIDEAKLHHYLTGPRQLENTGKSIRVRRVRG